MIRTDIKAIIYYQHSEEEVAELSRAIVPLAENIKAVATQGERHRMRQLLACDTFRYRDAVIVKNMLLRAAKHARANLSNYFPMMHQEILAAAENLEESVKHYWASFTAEERAIIPAP